MWEIFVPLAQLPRSKVLGARSRSSTSPAHQRLKVSALGFGVAGLSPRVATQSGESAGGFGSGSFVSTLVGRWGVPDRKQTQRRLTPRAPAQTSLALRKTTDFHQAPKCLTEAKETTAQRCFLCSYND